MLKREVRARAPWASARLAPAPEKQLILRLRGAVDDLQAGSGRAVSSQHWMRFRTDQGATASTARSARALARRLSPRRSRGRYVHQSGLRRHACLCKRLTDVRRRRTADRFSIVIRVNWLMLKPSMKDVGFRDCVIINKKEETEGQRR